MAETSSGVDSRDMSLAQWQGVIDRRYGDKDRKRGLEGNFLWLLEEIGELAGALRTRNAANLPGEFADVLAWLLTLANGADVDMQQAVWDKYGQGCPGCGQPTCCCDAGEKP